MDVKAMLDNLDVAAVASDADFNVIYINEKGKKSFKSLFNLDKVVGMNMVECHQPETFEKLKVLYQDFREKKMSLNYVVMDLPDGKATVVNVPFYDGDTLAGVVEMVFEGTFG
jgi:transcriptional regulator with PAS, ATPase and Fis domain